MPKDQINWTFGYFFRHFMICPKDDKYDILELDVPENMGWRILWTS